MGDGQLPRLKHRRRGQSCIGRGEVPRGHGLARSHERTPAAPSVLTTATIRLPAVTATLLTGLLLYFYARTFMTRAGAFSAPKAKRATFAESVMAKLPRSDASVSTTSRPVLRTDFRTGS